MALKKSKFLTLKQGKTLIELARKAITLSFDNKTLNLEEYPEFKEKRGVFVTLKKNGELRGCIGYPRPYYPLNEAITKAAIAAAFEDTRFLKLTKEELKKIEIEVSILTIPKKIVVKKPEDYLKKITIGKDGLIIETNFTSGLLLPQVAPEWNWNTLEFLENLCLKAGLGRNEWKELGVTIYSFQAQIFFESKGKIIEKKD